MERIILLLITFFCILDCYGKRDSNSERWVIESRNLKDSLIDSIYSEIPKRESQGLYYVEPVYKFACSEMPDSIEKLRIIYSQPLDKHFSPCGLHRLIVIIFHKNGKKYRIFSSRLDKENPIISKFFIEQESMIEDIYHQIDFSRFNLQWYSDYSSYFYNIAYDLVRK